MGRLSIDVHKKRHYEVCIFSLHQHLCYTKAMFAEQLPCPMEFADVKAILEPYWFMFNFALEYDNRPITYALVPRKMGRTEPTILIHYIWETSQANGAAAYPTWVPHCLRRSSQKYNHCDYSIRLFLSHLTLRLREVQAEIDWVAVDAKPRLLFHWHDRPLVLRVRHSVFSITTPSGGAYVADFTIEQFGYPSSMWFMTTEEYVEQCTTREEMEQPCEKEKRSARRGFAECTGKVWVVSELCRRLELTSWKYWNQKMKVDWMEAMVLEAFWWEGQERSLCAVSIGSADSCDEGCEEALEWGSHI